MVTQKENPIENLKSHLPFVMDDISGWSGLGAGYEGFSTRSGAAYGDPGDSAGLFGVGISGVAAFVDPGDKAGLSGASFGDPGDRFYASGFGDNFTNGLPDFP